MSPGIEFANGYILIRAGFVAEEDSNNRAGAKQVVEDVQRNSWWCSPPWPQFYGRREAFSDIISLRWPLLQSITCVSQTIDSVELPPDMASSQVEIASSSPFDCVLRDHNHREPPCLDSNAQAAFHNNLKVFARDHVRPTISIAPSDSDENSHHPSPATCPTRMPPKQDVRHYRRSFSSRTYREEKDKASSRRESEPDTRDQWNTNERRHRHALQLPSPGASSLVQIWEARVSGSDGLNSPAASSTHSGISCSDIAEEATSTPVEAGANTGDSFPDWESDRTAPSDLPSSWQGQDSDTGENERVRVADIIKRLTSHNASSSDDNDHEQPVITSPRLRGRQALIDLLMHIEHERQGELDRLAETQPVSRFNHRGRIQGVAGHNQLQPLSSGSELGRPQGSAIMLLRERFSTGVDRGSGTAQSSVPNSRSPRKKTLASEYSATSNQIREDVHHQEASTSEQHSTTSVEQLISDAAECVVQEDGSGLSSSDTWQGASRDAGIVRSQDQETADRITSQEIEEGTGEVNLFRNHNSWFSEISRPRRHWENLRQAWYRQMLSSNSENEEIRKLLERRRVSTCLASDFQEKMDQLMASHIRRLMQPENSGREVDMEEESGTSPVSQSYNMSDHFDENASSLQLPSPSLFGSWAHCQDGEVRDDSDQVTSASFQQHPSDDSDQLPSASFQLHPSLSPSPSASQSYYQDSPQSSCFASRPSIEMDLIYDLRGEMRQLHHEMAELRKSINSCINIQVNLQRFMKQKVSAPSQSVGSQGMKSVNLAPRKGNCYICYEMKIDSLLYRCGHMCTCLNCAQELQSSTGKCPICRASIVDVVRAFADT